ncbi:ribosome silencing factor [Acidobacteriota bacterium]
MSQKEPEPTAIIELPQEIKTSIASSQDKLAEDIVVMDLSELTSFTDYFIVMQGNSNKQNTALCDHIERTLKNLKIKPLSVEGRNQADWILMDYGYFIIHIFTSEMRQYYALEKLWGDAPRLSF